MMVEKELEDAKKLTPEERIRKLREIAKRNEEEIEKAQELIKESEAEIEEESSKKRFPIPEQEEVDVNRLFKRREQALEEQIAQEPVKKVAKEEARRQYAIQEIRYAPQQELRETWEEVRSDIYQTIQEGEAPTGQQMSKLDNIMYATQSKIRDGSYVKDSKEIHQAAKRLKEMYKG